MVQDLIKTGELDMNKSLIVGINNQVGDAKDFSISKSAIQNVEKVSQLTQLNNAVKKVSSRTNINGQNFENKKLSKALIMAGGFGTRMKELAEHIPKPLLLIQGKPILDYSIDLCKLNGIEDISISIFHMGNKIKEKYSDGKSRGVKIIYVEEPEPRGTAGALKIHQKWLNDYFMMCNSDELKDINLQDMFKEHIKTGALATIALTRVDNPSQYGVVELDKNKILRFVEKPKPGDEPTNLINAGLYIISPEVVDMVPNGFAMMEKDIFPKLAEQGKLYGFEFRGQWLDTGTIEKYKNVQGAWRGFTIKEQKNIKKN